MVFFEIEHVFANTKPLTIHLCTYLQWTCASETASRGKTNDSRFLSQVRLKLPLLYLIDSIVKNVGEVYKPLFQQEIVGIFVDAFDKVSND